MAIRVATAADIDAMHAIRMSVRENALSDPNRVRPEHYRAMLEEHGRGWVSEGAQEIDGFGIADHSRRNIWALFVAPGFERRGIGRHLLDAMVSWLFDQSSETLWLTTGRNTRAERFYRSAGWREIGIEPSGEIRFELSRRVRGAITRDSGLGGT